MLEFLILFQIFWTGQQKDIYVLSLFENTVYIRNQACFFLCNFRVSHNFLLFWRYFWLSNHETIVTYIQNPFKKRMRRGLTRDNLKVDYKVSIADLYLYFFIRIFSTFGTTATLECPRLNCLNTSIIIPYL